MPEENLTPDTQPDVTQLITPDVEGTDSQVTPAQPSETEEAIALRELNELLGKNFKDKNSALKSIKDTNSYAGKKSKEVPPEYESISKELAQLRKDIFYKDNPEYAPFRTLIEKLGTNPNEVVASEDFKTIYEPAKQFNETQKTKTVLQSNPRVAYTKTAIQKADELKKQGRVEEANQQVVTALLESLK